MLIMLENMSAGKLVSIRFELSVLGSLVSRSVDNQHWTCVSLHGINFREISESKWRERSDGRRYE